MRKLFGRQLLFFDGANGTMLQRAGIKPGELPEAWNITHPDIVLGIHEMYIAAGCDIVSANTFGSNRFKLHGSGYTAAELTAAGVRLARQAADSCGRRCFVALDIGPCGKLLRPLGDLDFDAAVEAFAQSVRAGAEAGADAVIIETMSDTYELKAAVLAVKESCGLPIIASATPDSRGKLLTGGDIGTVCALLEGLGVDVIGLNCGLGPAELLPFFRQLAQLSSLPLLLMPNAGIPRRVDGNTVYDVGPAAFAALMAEAAGAGAWLLGGCCGTTPQYIEALRAACRGASVPPVTKKALTVASSYGKALYFDGTARVIGERINPTGKPRLKQALRDGEWDYIMREGISQQEQGAEALDVNAGLPGINEAEALRQMVYHLQSVTDLPLQIDTADLSALEPALRIYNGKPVINSISGKERSLAHILPLMKKYGALAIALTLDDDGIPESADGRMAVARKIIDRAAQHGIGRHQFLFDPLTMALSAGDGNAAVTLECVRRLRDELGARSSLGVSNISFGLPQREKLNAAFLTLALGAGLDAAIINPHSSAVMEATACTRALMARDPQCEKYIEAFAPQADIKPRPAARSAPPLFDCVIKGLRLDAAAAAKAALEKMPALEIIETQLIPALNDAGRQFERGTLFLPQLLMSAEAAKAAFEAVRAAFGADGGQPRGTIIIATVEGDIHDIGKNIAKALLENYRFRVIDLGKDVPPDTIADAAALHGAGLVGLSALMTTTVAAMETTINAVRRRAPSCKIMCGGAVLTEDYAMQIGADRYVRDAMASVRFAEQVFASR